jgi:hypothetical protein
VASYDAAVTQHLRGCRGEATGSVVGGVGGHALDEALAGCMFGGMWQCGVFVEEGGGGLTTWGLWVVGSGI